MGSNMLLYLMSFQTVGNRICLDDTRVNAEGFRLCKYCHHRLELALLPET